MQGGTHGAWEIVLHTGLMQQHHRGSFGGRLLHEAAVNAPAGGCIREVPGPSLADKSAGEGSETMLSRRMYFSGFSPK